MYSAFSNRVRQHYIPITKQYTTPLNRHLDGPGTTTSHRAPTAMLPSPWKSLMEAGGFSNVLLFVFTNQRL